ncbi:tetratricopeptide repeat protein [Allohahella sp. A8]|uniref:tetratricopeptide repeat protein n=1 Tax=Allohahella sp. A8 TaxID=3141461 RepID=UPI003A7F7A04
MNKLQLVVLLVLAMTGCASQQTFVGEIGDPEQEVTRLIEHELVNIQSGEYCRPDPQSLFNGCDGALRRLTQLFTKFPDYERLQLALAVAYQARNKNREAQYYLDVLLANNRPRPEAAILAARLAMEEGNTRRAQALLEPQMRLSPMHPGIHETLAAVFYLNHEPQKGFSALAAAEQLGAPEWRIAYHRGLLYELSDNESAACEQYAKSYTHRDSFRLPEGRILGLTHNPVCLELAKFLGGA